LPKPGDFYRSLGLEEKNGYQDFPSIGRQAKQIGGPLFVFAVRDGLRLDPFRDRR
jgi:hypothetical protein